MGQRHRRLVAASCCIWLLTVVALVSCQNAPDVAGLRSLATEGDAAAQFDLGFMYRNGEGVPQDNGEALRWYRLALFLSRCGHRIFPCPRSYSSAHFESFSLLRFNPAAGSSPRLRGTVPKVRFGKVFGRFIPALAGNRKAFRSRRSASITPASTLLWTRPGKVWSGN